MDAQFTSAIRKVLALRAGYRCSRCGASTMGGPRSDPKALGVAAHISAAAPAGPRFDPAMSPETRASLQNGIWLCFNCAHAVDADPVTFTAAVLRELKARAERDIIDRVAAPRPEAAEEQKGTDHSADGLRALRVFLCHASEDKAIMRSLYRSLHGAGVDAWLDEEKLLPGQDWHKEIAGALRQSDAVIVALSRASVRKTGFVQREIRYALDFAAEHPDGAIFVIPLVIDDCSVPNSLAKWQWLRMSSTDWEKRLMHSLQSRAEELGARMPAEWNAA